ncbi:MAG: HAD family hydrolase [Deltaproteobacteria bacterium]|nr:HAD family hydrolase [Deltaproteobacteria bacterium]
MINNIEHFIWDLDGTLIDSSPDIIASIEKSIDDCGFKRFDIPRNVIGLPLQMMLSRSNAALSQEEIDRIIFRFREIYDSIEYNETQVIDGACKVLEYLVAAGKGNYCVTNKPLKPTLKILQNKNLSVYFIEVISPDTIGGKVMSKTEMLIHFLSTKNVKQDHCMYIGDHENDIEAAHSSGIPCCIILGGYGSKCEILKRNPEHIVDNFLMLKNFLETRE